MKPNQKVVVNPTEVITEETQLSYSEHIAIVNKLTLDHSVALGEITNARNKAEEELAKLKEAINNVAPYVRNDIPSMFEIAGIAYKVVIEENNKENYGTYSPSTCQVTLYRKSEGDDINPQMINKVFYHELIHAIANAFHLDDLYNDEKTIDNVARGIMMFLQTRRYIKPEENTTKQDNQ